MGDADEASNTTRTEAVAVVSPDAFPATGEPSAEEPAGERSFGPENELTLPVASVARRLGVAPSTLRTWDRRYGVGPSRHINGRHRRYGVADVGRLELMQRALLRGVSTAEAARYALAEMPKRSNHSGHVVSMPHRPRDDQAREKQAAPVRLLDDHGRQSRAARRLSAAAVGLDGDAVQRMLIELIAEYGAVSAWLQVIEPVVTALDTQRQDGDRDIGAEVSYFFRGLVSAALIRATPILAEPRNHRSVLLTPTPGEPDDLALRALIAGLGQRRVAGQLLSGQWGNSPSADVLSAVVHRTSPAAIVLLANRHSAAQPRVFSRLFRHRQRARMFAWGAGWNEVNLPPNVEHLADVEQATRRIEYVLCGHS